MTTDIPKDQLVRGAVYELKSRNLIAGVWNGENGFIGIREKFGEEYLFTEYLYELGPPYGTAHPIKLIGWADTCALVEHYGLICKNCDKGAWKDKEGEWPDNEHCGGGCSNDDRSVFWTINQLLFDVLRAMEEPIRQRIAAEFPKLTPPWR